MCVGSFFMPIQVTYAYSTSIENFKTKDDAIDNTFIDQLHAFEGRNAEDTVQIRF